MLRTGRHKSNSDQRQHATVRLKTELQKTNGQHQVAHIYMTAPPDFVYTGHKLWANVKRDEPPRRRPPPKK
jgi:hypothetical protein